MRKYHKGSLTVTLMPNDSFTIAMPLPEGYYSEAERISTDALRMAGPNCLIGCRHRTVGTHGTEKADISTVEFIRLWSTSADAGF